MTIEQKFFLMHRFHSREEYGGESPHEHPAPWMGGDRASFGRDGSRPGLVSSRGELTGRHMSMAIGPGPFCLWNLLLPLVLFLRPP